MIANANHTQSPLAINDAALPDDVELEYRRFASSDDSGELLNLYLNKYPNGYYAADARERLQALSTPEPEPEPEPEEPQTVAAARSLDADQAPAAEKLFWESLNRDDPQEVQSYLNAFPDGHYAAQARQLLQQAAPVNDIDAWRAVKDSADPAAFQGFIDRFPASAFAELARLRLSKLQTAAESPELVALLRRARQALEDDRLTTPVENSAVKWAEQALAIHPGDVQANALLQDVIDRYVGWARSNVRRGRAARAERYLSRAQALERYASAEQRAALGELSASLSSLRRAQVVPPAGNGGRRAKKGFWRSLGDQLKNFNDSGRPQQTGPAGGHQRL